MLRPRLKLLIALVGVLALGVAILAAFHARTASANPATGIAQIDGGLFHTCAVTTTGGVKCWGVAVDSAITGFVDFGRTPADVAGLTSGVTSVSTGLYHVCAVTTSSTVKCLGRHYGTDPVDVPAFGSNVVSISAGWDYTCALKTTGGIACYFTDGGTLASTGLNSGITQVAASFGFHTCVLMTGGTVKCWGFNEHGQIGDGTTTPRPTAVTVSGLSGVTQVSLGTFYSCALTSAGGVKCWGDGFGTTPVNVSGMTSGIAQISASVEHLCARTTSGGVLCRGLNRYGQLGDNYECGMTCTTPVVPAGLSSGVASINTGHEHSCAILTSGQAKCWGFNGLGSVGDASSEVRRPVPVYVAVSTQKPTPTATPCPPSDCPTPTPTPYHPPTVLDFAIGVDANGDGQDECRTSGYVPATCNIQVGSQFDIKLYLNGLPPDITEYDAFAAQLTYVGLPAKNVYSVTWPDCIFPVSAYQPGTYFNFACITFGGLTSVYTGLLGRTTFTCTQSGSVTLVHGSADTNLIGSNSGTYYEPPDHTDQLTINCVNLPPTPTFTPGPPTPQSVGGIAFDAGASGGGGIASAIAVGLVLLGCGALGYVGWRARGRPG